MKDLQNLKLVVKITRMGAAVLSMFLMFQEIMMLISRMEESIFLVRAPSQWLSEEGRSQTMDSEFSVGRISLVLWDVDVILAFCFSSEFRQKRQRHLVRWVQMSGRKGDINPGQITGIIHKQCVILQVMKIAF